MKTFLNRRQSLFVKLLISYLVILIIPATVGITSYTKSSQVVKQEMENYNVAILQQAQKVLDERLRSVDQLATDISLDSKVQNLLQAGDDKSPETLLNTFKSIKDLPKYNKISKFIIDFFIYFKNGDYVLTSKGKFSFSNFFGNELKSSDEDYDWRQLMEGHYVRRLFPAQNVTYSNSGKNVIKYISSLPMGSGKSSQGNFTVLIDVNDIKETLMETDVLKNGVSYIADKDGQILMYVGDKSLIKEIPAKDGNAGFLYNGSKKDETIVAYARSTVNDWLYVSVIPTEDYMGNLRFIEKLIILVTFIGILVGILMSVLLARKNFRPIKKTMATLTECMKNHTESFNNAGSSNELDIISNAVVNTFREYKSIKDTLQVQLPVLRGNLLLQIMKDNFHELSELERSMKLVGISFDYDEFCVLTLDIMECSDQELENEWVLVKVVVSNVFEELGNNRGKAYIVDTEWNQMVLVVNINPECQDKIIAIKELATEGMDFVGDKFSIMLNIGIGRVYRGIEGISKSYGESVKALQYGMLSANGSLTAFSDMPGITQSYAYSFNTSERLANLVKSGDLNKVKLVLQQIIKENFRNQKLSLEMARCIFFDIMSTAIKVLHSIEVNYNEVFSASYDPYKQLTACKNINEMEETLKYIFDVICRYINEKQRSHNETLKEDIMRYLDEHFTEQDLSLIKVAGHFKLNHTYLSFFFKEQTGENFSEYIRNLKVERAVKLLRESEASIEEISNILGYANSGVMIRNFKKSKGITPGQYRNNAFMLQNTNS